MNVRITLPSAIEGDWQLEEPNTIVIKPHFYKKLGSQTLLNFACVGDGGRRRDAFLTVDPLTANLSVHKIDEVMVPIKPRFDTLAVATAQSAKKKAEA